MDNAEVKVTSDLKLVVIMQVAKNTANIKVNAFNYQP